MGLCTIPFLATGGCGDRFEVAKDKALEKIDSLLGKLVVQRKQIETSINAMDDSITGIRKAKIKAEVRVEQLGRQLQPLTDKKSSIVSTLKKLRDYLTADAPAEIGGKTYTIDEMKSMSSKLIAAGKELDTQIGRLQGPTAQMTKVAETLCQRQAQYQIRLTDLQSQVAEIDAKKIALDAMKEASTHMGALDKSFASNVDNLEHDIAELHAEIETALRVESEEWDEATAERDISSVDETILLMNEPQDSVSEIDAFLESASN